MALPETDIREPTSQAISPSAMLPVVPGYKVIRKVKEGGMGVVYEARQLATNRVVALKMIRADLIADQSTLQRFKIEIDAVGLLQLPSFVKVYEVYVDNTNHGITPFYSMEFVDGGTLEDSLKRKPLDPGQAAELVEVLARAMHLAHQKDIIHRDLKPSNVLLTQAGEPKISDFGLAKFLARKLEVTPPYATPTFAILGTPHYMAPEQAAGKTRDVGPEVDIYALGAILYACLTGSPPFQGDNLEEILSKVQHQDPVLPKRLQHNVPVRLERICLRCLQKKPEARYRTAEDLANEIREFQEAPPNPRDGGTGIINTLEQERQRLRDIENQIDSFYDSTFRNDSPIIFFGTACLQTYIEALANVKQRFWTTTFLSSGFWTRPNIGVRNANLELMKRLKQTGQEHVRRLILLSQDLQQEEKSRKQRMIHLRREGNWAEIHRLKKEFDNLCENIRATMSEHCEVRVTQVASHIHEHLREEVKDYDPEDSEIAVYDKFRVDNFTGGRIGRITDVTIYSRAYKQFDACLDRVEEYFREAWQDARPAEDFLQMVARAYSAGEYRIDYVSNWLAMYEYDLSEEDKALKSAELDAVRAALNRRRLWGELRRFLDVGTCTGRYLLALREAVVPQSEGGCIVGIDDDEDCVEFANGRKAKDAQGDQRIAIYQADFCSDTCPEFNGNFNLITCMLGTLSHFGWDKDAKYADSLQVALRRMSKLLAPDGLLVICNWSRFACKGRHMLRIYSPQERDRLAIWTCDESELTTRLDAANLSVEAVERPHPKIDLFFCRCKGQ